MSVEDLDLDPETGEGFVLVEKIAACQARINAQHAAMLQHIAALHESACMEPSPRPPAASKTAERTGRALENLTRADLTENELIHRLKLGTFEAWKLVRTARALTARLPTTLTALHEGRLDLARAVIIADQLQTLADDHHHLALREGLSPDAAEAVARHSAAAVEEELFDEVTDCPPAQTHKDVAWAIHRIDPDYARRHAHDQVKSRSVTHRTHPGDATGEIHAHLGAPEALAAYNVIDTYARTARHTGAHRSLDELRADAFFHLIVHGHLPDNNTPTDLNLEDATLVPQAHDLHRNTPEDNTSPTTTPSPTTTDRADADARADADDRDDRDDRDDAGDAGDRGDARFTPASTATNHSAEAATQQPPPQRPTQPEATETEPPTLASTRSDTTGPDQTKPGTSIPSPTKPGSPQPGPPQPGPTTTGPPRPGTPPRPASGLRAHIQVTVGLETLLGLNNDPADLTGHGPITADTARDLAFNAGSTWRRLVTDPLSQQLLDYGRTTYRPPVGLADFVKARDVTCRNPTCTHPATTSDLDHIIAWPAGTTSEQNLAANCRHDHGIKHHSRWTHHLSTNPDHPPGTIIMTSPTGHIYLSYPYTYPEPQTKTLDDKAKSSIFESESRRQEENQDTNDPGAPPF